MEHQLPRLARQPLGSAEATFLADPETGQPVVYSTRVVGTPAGANGVVLFDTDLTGVMTALVDIRGTFVATVTFEQTVDETNWFPVQGLTATTFTSPVTSATAPGVFAFPAIGKRLRARTTAWTSGSVTSSVLLSDVPVVSLGNGSTVSTTSVVNAGSNSGGLAVSKVRSAASLNLTSVKGSSARLYGWRLFNASASPRYLKFYNKASAPVVATDVPAFTIVLAPGQVADFDTTQGVSFGTGLAYAITGGLADTDATNVVADDIVGALLYA